MARVFSFPRPIPILTLCSQAAWQQPISEQSHSPVTGKLITIEITFSEKCNNGYIKWNFLDIVVQRLVTF